MSEYRRNSLRIIANYVRLFIVVGLGLALVRLLLALVGKETVGLIAYVGSTVGFAVTVEEIVGWSMIRELGAARHSGDQRHFREMYNSAPVVSASAAVLTVGAF